MTDHSSFSASDLIAAGYVSHADALAEVRREVGDPRSGPHAEAYRITTAGGVAVEVLPERGLDLGSLWYAGQPLAWRSALGPRSGSLDPSGEGWIGRFGGGILVTCGLDNIGPAREGCGLHGSHHATPAQDVAIVRLPDGAVRVTGTIDSAHVFGRAVYVQRTIEVAIGAARIDVCDRVVNAGTTSALIPLLYHLNFGAPFVMPGTSIAATAARHVPRDRDAEGRNWQQFPDPTEDVIESVWEHSSFAPDAAGRAAIVVDSAATAIRATVSWDTTQLDRALQWVYPARRGWALGIEPANAPIFGPGRSRPDAGAPALEPGETRGFGCRIELSPR